MMETFTCKVQLVATRAPVTKEINSTFKLNQFKFVQPHEASGYHIGQHRARLIHLKCVISCHPLAPSLPTTSHFIQDTDPSPSRGLQGPTQPVSGSKRPQRPFSSLCFPHTDGYFTKGLGALPPGAPALWFPQPGVPPPRHYTAHFLTSLKSLLKCHLANKAYNDPI